MLALLAPHDGLRERLEDLWFSMHGSDGQYKRMMAATCYLDDSGTEDRTVLLGGCIMGKDSFIRLEKRWLKLLSEFRIESLHMTDFVRPHGQHIGMYPELKVALFTRAAKLIKSLAEYSVSVDVPLDIYRRLFSKEFQRNALSPYAMAFIGISQLNLKIARDNGGYPDRLAYLMDTGNPYSGQIQFGHALSSFLERQEGFAFTGRLTFENDLNNAALQAADVISWSVQRLAVDGLKNEFAPLSELFVKRYTREGLAQSPHYFYSAKPEMLVKLGWV